MSIRLLQLNMWGGIFLDNIVNFVTENYIDILTLQEVTGGIASDDKKTDTFNVLQTELQMKGIQSKDFGYSEDTTSYMGQAILYKTNFNLVSSKEIRLKPYEAVSKSNFRSEDLPRTAITAEFMKDGKLFTVVTTHGAWGPTAVDSEEKLRQGKILMESLKKITTPLILTGDFNLPKESQTIQNYETLLTNLSRKYVIKNTLNSRVHFAKHLFPTGLAVDHLFISPTIKDKEFKVLDSLDLSDHLGLYAELEI